MTAAPRRSHTRCTAAGIQGLPWCLHPYDDDTHCSVQEVQGGCGGGKQECKQDGGSSKTQTDGDCM